MRMQFLWYILVTPWRQRLWNNMHFILRIECDLILLAILRVHGVVARLMPRFNRFTWVRNRCRVLYGCGCSHRIESIWPLHYTMARWPIISTISAIISLTHLIHGDRLVTREWISVSFGSLRRNLTINLILLGILNILHHFLKNIIVGLAQYIR